MSNYYNRQWRLPNNENKSKQSNYSMSFDGTNYIDLGNSTQVQPVKEMSISAWINASSLSTYLGIVSCQYTSASYDGFSLRLSDTSSNKIQFAVKPIYGSTKSVNSTSTITTGQWYHLVVTYDGANIKLYFNGSLESSTTMTENIDYTDGSRNTLIGSLYTSALYFNGQIDAVAIFNYALSSSQVTTLYGSSSTGIGNPMTLNPVSFYQLGDKSVFNGANYLAPNIAVQEADGDIATSYSPYALNFDSASSDYIDCGNDSSLQFQATDAFSVSAWININATTSGADFIVSNGLWNTYPYSGWGLEINGSNTIRFDLTDDNVNQLTIDSSGLTLNTNTWYNVVFTYDGSNSATGMNFYLNGSLTSKTIFKNQTLSTITYTSINLNIAARENGIRPWNGSLSNVSVWNAALTSAQVTEIYSEGLPQNLLNHSAVSSLVSWWQLGSNSSFNSSLNQWTCIDEKGTNTGESSQTFNEDAIVDGVGSYANGVGTSGLEVVGSAFGSSANALSINMDVLDRTEDTPN